MVNQDPSNIDEDVLPEIDEPIERDTVQNMMVGVYSTDQEGVWMMQIRDWSNRVIEATVYDKNREDIEENGGCDFRPLNTPDEMEDVAYLKELLKQRVERLEDELAKPQNG
ncbi:MAG: hypothetical protein SV377_07580, partial [Halobacteria archaeon]|nr:hypothetical protein [Halobacteria archaeon]